MHDNSSRHFIHLLSLQGAEFLEVAYQLMLGRPVDPDGLATYSAHMSGGKTKLEIIAALYESEEGRAYERRIPDFVSVVASLSVEPPDSALGPPDLQTPIIGHVRELLSLEDLAFVECAFRTLLHRPPDAVGLVNYLGLVRAGASKMRIISAMRRSQEGRKVAATLQGLDAAIFRYRLARLPLARVLFRPPAEIEGDSPLECGLRGLANRHVRSLADASRLQAEQMRRASERVADLNEQLTILRDQNLGRVQQLADFTERLSERIRHLTDMVERGPVDYRVDLPGVENPQVSIVIPMYNQLEYTINCLKSLGKCEQKATFEVIVIDDQSDSAAFRALSRIRNLRLLRNIENQGFLRSCNHAVSYARGNFVVLLNNDTEVTGEWLDALMRVFEARPDAGLVGSKLVYPDGTLQESGGILWQDGGAWNYGRGDDASKPAYNYVRQTDYCSAASVMIRKDLWNSLGGFDPRYVPAYCEDSDLAFRVREAGYQVYVQPKSVVVHHEGRSNGTDIGSGIKHYQALNNKKLLARWGAVLARHRPNGVDVFKARERSLHRPVILFIDHYLPHYDQDAGSRTIWAFVQLFLHEGFSVKFLGDNFFPHQPYQKVMEEMGIEVLTGSWMAQNWEEWLRQNGQYLDYVMLSRAHIAPRYLGPLRTLSRAKLLYYGHDLISRTARNQYAFTKDPAKLAEAKCFRELEGKVFEMVDVVYYPSQVEIDELALTHPQLNAQVITPYVYEIDRATKNTSPDELADRNGLLFVGGFRHPPNAEAMQWFCREVLPVLQQRLPGIHMTIAGSHPPPDIEALAGPDITVTGYISDESLAKLYAASRLVVVPLLTGGGIKGKVIEAMSRGVPVVTTPIGAEGILEAENAVLITQPGDFAEQVISVYNDFYRLNELAVHGTVIIDKYYSQAALRKEFSAEIRFHRDAV